MHINMDVTNNFDKLKSDYEAVFTTEVGKRVLEDICKSGCLYRSFFSTEPLEMARDEGKRIIALHIKNMATPNADVKKEVAIK